MCEGYILEWLDVLVTVTLNPQTATSQKISSEDIIKLNKHIAVEKDKILSHIKSVIFKLTDEAKIRCSVEKYHSGLISLVDQAMEISDRGSGQPQLKSVWDSALCCMDELLSFIEKRFGNYLSRNERVSAIYLLRSRKDISRRLSGIIEKAGQHCSYRPTLDIVIHELVELMNLQTEKHPHTFQEISYINDVSLAMERLDLAEEHTVYSGLDEVLVYMNFNSKGYIKDLTQRVMAHINGINPITDKFECLIFLFKSFKQLQRKKGVVFCPANSDLYKQICNWFIQEIAFLEKQMLNSFIPSKNITVPKVTRNNEVKILSMLSVDQMALILRAADELKIITARSLSSVFKSLAPYLSTPYQENISYDSMRSKSYSAEVRDKEVVIQVLQQVISKIKEY